MPTRQKHSILPDTLVSTEWLADHLGRPDLAIVDIRGYVKATEVALGVQHSDYIGAIDEYEAGHIRSSVFIDWTADIVDLMNPVKAQIASPEDFARAMSLRGIGDETDVVIVDHTGGHFATRLWWALQYYGHDRAAVLDGGYSKWSAEQRPVTTQVAHPARATFTPKIRPEIRVEAEEVASMIGDEETLIVDAREANQYSGAIRRHTHGGHVPTAVNITAKSLVNADGTWKSDAELSQILADGGVKPNQKVIAYCNGGVTATAVLFALSRTGHDNYANYDGSWNEWGERPDLPTEVSAG